LFDQVEGVGISTSAHGIPLILGRQPYLRLDED
jgi:hypothetical protein